MPTTLIRNVEFVLAWDGRLLAMDDPAAAARLHEAQKRVMAKVPDLDRGHRHVDAIAPPTFRTA